MSGEVLAPGVAPEDEDVPRRLVVRHSVSYTHLTLPTNREV